MPTKALDFLDRAAARIAPAIRADWRERAAAATQDAVIELADLEAAGEIRDGLTPRDRLAIVAAILLLMRRRFEAPMAPDRRGRIRSTIIDLFRPALGRLGAAELLPDGRIARGLANDLVTLPRIRILDRWTGIEARVAERVEAFVGLPEARRTPQDRRQADESLRAARRTRIRRENELRAAQGRPTVTTDPLDLANPLTTKAELAAVVVPERLTGLPDPLDRESWARNLESMIRANMGGVAETLAVELAVVAANAISILDFQRRGIQFAIAFNNPPDGPDDRTTNFCRWVHLKRIGVANAAVKLDALRAAINARDEAAIKRALPVVRTRTGTTNAQHRVDFLRVGIPPYHWNCRTVLREPE